MQVKRGFTMIEIILVMIVVGVLAAVAIPSYQSSIWVANMQAGENNLRAIAAAEQKYYEDHGQYYISPTGPSNDTGISTNLSLSMGAESSGLNYLCITAGNAYGCTASSSATPPAGQPNKIQMDYNGNLTCLTNAVTMTCPQGL